MDKLDMHGLRKLYQSNPNAKAVLDLFASYSRNQTRTAVNTVLKYLAPSNSSIDRKDVVRVFRELQKLGCGYFKIGRRGWETGFVWSLQMVDVGKAAAGQANVVDPVMENGNGSVAGPESSGSLTHEFRLRPNCSTILNLPSDFNSAEAERLAQFIRALPFNR
jgi:hypothetical protein